MQISQFDGFGHHVDHAAAGHSHFSSQFVAQIYDLLNAVNIGGKAGHANPFVFPPGKQCGERLSHLAFAGGAAGLFRIGGILQQR